MLSAMDSVSNLLLALIALLVFGVNAFAFIDAVRQRADAFTAAGKLTKRLWLLITGIAAALGFIFLTLQLGYGGLYVFHFVNLIALVASGVYLADVRPAIKQITGGGNAGPYGGW